MNHAGIEIKIKNHEQLGYFSAQLFRLRDGERKSMPDHFASFGEALKGARLEAEKFATTSAAQPSRSAQGGA